MLRLSPSLCDVRFKKTRAGSGLVLSVIFVLFLAACDSGGSNTGNDDGNGNDGADINIGLTEILPAAQFQRPLDIQNAGDGTNRLFIVEQRGMIYVAQNISSPGGADIDVFLDIRDRVFFDESESGLLGLAFHPQFETNGYFYVNYTASNPARTVIARYSLNGDTAEADPDSEVVLMELAQPRANHNGGQLVFGPKDGYLYIAGGDGGVDENSQNMTTLLGSILRIDVDNAEDGMNYGIPDDNPFSGNDSGFREEIFAYGFRNPWRIGFDELFGTLFTGDVGNARREEIDVVESGKNYGWSIMEGTICFDPPSGCDMSGLELPILDYGRDQGGTVIGGFVYRGSEVEGLAGKYIYGDFVSGKIWALGYDGDNVTDNTQIAEIGEFSLTAFGTDENDEAYLSTLGGTIYKITNGD